LTLYNTSLVGSTCAIRETDETIVATVTVEHCGIIENLKRECVSVTSAKRWIAKKEKVAIA